MKPSRRNIANALAKAEKLRQGPASKYAAKRHAAYQPPVKVGR